MAAALAKFEARPHNERASPAVGLPPFSNYRGPVKHVFAAALAFAVSALAVFPATASAQGRGQAPAGRGLVSSEGTVRVIVRFNEAFVPEGQLPAGRSALQRLAIARAEARVLAGPAARHIRRSSRFETIPYAVMEVTSAGWADLAKDPDVLAIQYDAVERPMLVQSTALIQSTLTTTAGQTGAAWSIAVLDTGVERNHGFFANRVVYEGCFSTAVAGQSTSLCPFGINPSGADEQTGSGAAAPCSEAGCEHGTHVAGIAAGRSATLSGVAPDANILAFQVFSRFNSTTLCAGASSCVMSYASDQLRALERVYALRSAYNIAAVNISLGGDQFSSQAQCDADASNAARKAAIDNLRSVGIATVVASGNGGLVNALSAPACISSAISVGATSDSWTPWVTGYSNSASFLSLLAPGDQIQSSVANGGFGVMSGTSMATPHVAGAFAVMKARVPSASVSSILTALQTTGRSVTDPRNGIVKPLIQLNDALAVLAPAAPEPPPTCTLSIDPSSVSIGAIPATGTIVVTSSDSTCTWTAVSNDAFITITSGASGRGSGTTNFGVQANTSSSPRYGTVTIAGRTFRVTQAAAPVTCTYSITPTSVSIGHRATTGTISIATQPECTWTASTFSPFVTLGNTVGRFGSDTLSFSVTTNGTAEPRTGTATIAGQSFSVTQAAAPIIRLAPDLDNDGDLDLIWQNRREGYLAGWMMNGLTLSDSALFSPSRVSDPNWRIAATADMDGDNKLDLVWQEDTEGWIGIWKMNGLTLVSSLAITVERVPDTDWKIVAAQDFNGDGKADIVWHHRTQGYIALWYMDGVTVVSSELFSPGQVTDSNWQIEAAADFNADGKPDLLWRNQADGSVVAWLMDGIRLIASRALRPGRVTDTNWRIAAVGDVNRDNMADLVWHDTANGWIGVWLMDGTTLASSIAFFPERVADVNWRIVGPK